MENHEFESHHIDTRLLDSIAQQIKEGAVFVFPTDSVYACGCTLSNKDGIERLLKITDKKEKHSKLSIICHSIKEVSKFTLPFSNHVFKTMNRYLPGPYTFILKADKSVRKYFDNNKNEIGVRIPDHPVLTALMERLDEPIIATSLNKDGDSSSDYFIDPHVIHATYQYDIDFIINAGIGKAYATTILDCTGDGIEIVRQGEGTVD